MNIYLVKRKDDCKYDEYDSAVVVAKSKKDASQILPDGSEYDETPTGWWHCRVYWSADNLEITHIGKASSKMKHGLVSSSYNAG